MNFEDEFDVVPPEGNVFVNHEINGRSGHLGHALVEYEEGKILAFYPNCSLDEKGHSAVGWMEYKRSEIYLIKCMIIKQNQDGSMPPEHWLRIDRIHGSAEQE